VQPLFSLVLANPRRANERFPAYRLTRLVAARFDMDDVEVAIFADLARPFASVSLRHGTARQSLAASRESGVQPSFLMSIWIYPKPLRSLRV
jgi:hypothetical protein